MLVLCVVAGVAVYRYLLCVLPSLLIVVVCSGCLFWLSVLVVCWCRLLNLLFAALRAIVRC